MNYKIKRFWRNFGIDNLILYVVITLGALWAVGYLIPGFDEITYTYLDFDRSAILHGQVWRLITFMFLIGSPSPIFVIFSLYFYYLIGTALEQAWGSHKFTVFFLAGMLLMNAAGFISGYTLPGLFYTSMFCAFASIYPDHEFLIFFIIPVKAKYMAYLDLAGMVIALVFSLATRLFGVSINVVAIFVLLGIFFGKGVYTRINAKLRYRKFKKSFNKRND